MRGSVKFFTFWRRWAGRASIGVLGLLVPGESSAAQGREANNESPLILRRLAGPVILDGVSDEPAWDAVPPLPLTMYVPVFRGALTERSEIRIAYNDDYLYVSGRFFDREPSGIRVNSLYRDRSSGDDVFGILVDAFNDNDTGLWFWTNPAGVRGDATISGDGQSTNDSWNTYWDVAAAITDEGWFAEMRIPMSSLGFQALDGRVDMGITAYRYIARKNERQVFPEIPPDFSFLRPSLAHGVVLDGVRTRKPIYVTPYVTSGLDQTALLDQQTSQYGLDDDFSNEIGGDIKYNFTSNFTLDVTVNTDFAQVEADDQQINLTRFSLFFPEKRQFFQERSGVFDFSTGGSTRLFHSRRIGLDDDGNAIRLLGGARLVGRAGEWDVGALNMQTARSDHLPAENFGVLRARRRVFNEYSNAGAMLTTRLGDDGSYNVAYGLDGTFRIAADDYLTVQWAQSFDDSIIGANGFQFDKTGLLRVSLNRRRNRGFTYGFTGRWSGADYRPNMGFTTRQDFSDLFYSFSYFHYPTGDGPFRRIDPFQLFGSVALRNADGTVESAFVEHDFDLQWKSGASLGLDLELYYEDLREPLSLAEGTSVPIGRYVFPGFAGDYNMPLGRLFRTQFNWGIQQFYDGWSTNFVVRPNWNVSRFLEFNLRYQVDLVRFPERDEGFDAHIIRFRTRAALNTRLSFNAFVQFSNTANFGGANVRVRYNFREGNDLWLVYDQGVNLDRHRTVPVLPFTDNRTVLLKYTHTFAR